MTDTARRNASAASRRGDDTEAATLGSYIEEAEQARLDMDPPERVEAPRMGDLVAEADSQRETDEAATRTASTSDRGDADDVDLSQFGGNGGYYTIDGEKVRGREAATALARKKGLI